MMTNPKVACTDVYEEAVLIEIKKALPTGWFLEAPTSYERPEQERVVTGADFILAGWAAVPGWMFDLAPNVKLVQKFGVGYDKIDLDKARQRGVPVAIAAGGNAAPVADLAILLMLALGRRLTIVNQAVRNGAWPKAEMRAIATHLRGKLVGLIGLGHVGREVAVRARAFGAELAYFDTVRLNEAEEQSLGVRFKDIDALLSEADIVSLHLPLTDTTRHLIDERSLRKMKRTAFLINTARGGLISEVDLCEALENGEIAGAGLDVFEQEPLKQSSRLAGLDTVVLTPHIGGTVKDNVRPMAMHCFENMQRVASGQPVLDGDRVA